MKQFLHELKSVWSTFSDETKNNWAMLLGGMKDKNEVMAILNSEDDR